MHSPHLRSAEVIRGQVAAFRPHSWKWGHCRINLEELGFDAGGFK
jgi:hypothetical protein